MMAPPLFDSTIRIDARDPLPRHAQVQRILRDMVSSGRLRPGDKIPAEIQLAGALGVSKMTVNKALLALAASGLLVREVGRGTFVAAASGVVPRRPRIALSFVEGATNLQENYYYSELYEGVKAALAGAAVDVETSLAPLLAGDYVAEEKRAPADGRLIIAPRAQSISSIEALASGGKPVVIVGASWPAIDVPSVDSDNKGGALSAVEHLAGLGHRRIALFFAENETANMQDRIAGYRRGLSAHGIKHEPRFEVRAQAAWRAGEAGEAHLGRLLSDANDPVTAVFAPGFYLALEAMRITREAGRGVPNDVSVVGFDDPLSAQLMYPALTTLRQPLRAMGERAAARLLRLVLGQEEPLSVVAHEVLPAELVVRRSTAPPPPNLT